MLMAHSGAGYDFFPLSVLITTFVPSMWSIVPMFGKISPTETVNAFPH